MDEFRGGVERPRRDGQFQQLVVQATAPWGSAASITSPLRSSEASTWLEALEDQALRLEPGLLSWNHNVLAASATHSTTSTSQVLRGEWIRACNREDEHAAVWRINSPQRCTRGTRNASRHARADAGPRPPTLLTAHRYRSASCALQYRETSTKTALAKPL